MLVLSRRENERVVFPSLGISIEVLRIRGNAAKLGIDAPAEVPIQRAEISGLKALDFTLDEDSAKSRLHQVSSSVRQRVTAATEALNRLHQQIEEKDPAAAEQAIFAIFHQLQTLDKEVRSAVQVPVAIEAERRALIVEDDVNESNLLAGLLRLSGFDVVTCTDGADALDYLSMHSQPDFVLLDMFMPRCDGPTFVNRIRANPLLRTMKLFALSGTAPSDLGVRLGPGGIDHWFPKPVNPERLVDELAREIQAA